MAKMVAAKLEALAAERDAFRKSYERAVDDTLRLHAEVERLNELLKRWQSGKMWEQHRAERAEAEVERLRKLLTTYTSWMPGKGIIQPIPPKHGSCCTCQKCGRYNENPAESECVCEHNEIEAALKGDA